MASDLYGARFSGLKHKEDKCKGDEAQSRVAGELQ